MGLAGAPFQASLFAVTSGGRMRFFGSPQGPRSGEGGTMALAFMRRQKWWLKYLLGLVVVSFIILYIPALIGTDARGTPGEVLAEVGKVPITVGEYRRLYNTQ